VIIKRSDGGSWLLHPFLLLFSLCDFLSTADVKHLVGHSGDL